MAELAAKLQALSPSLALTVTNQKKFCYKML